MMGLPTESEGTFVWVNRAFVRCPFGRGTEKKKKKGGRRREMGLLSMPSAAEAFLPIVLVTNVLLPLALLRDGIRWVVLQVMLGYDGDGDRPHGGGPLDREPEMETATAPSEGQEGRRGVSLRRFKSLRYDGGHNECCCCCVCLHGFEGEEDVSQVLSCRHFFHRGCLDGWLDRKHTTCPLCRSLV